MSLNKDRKMVAMNKVTHEGCEVFQIRDAFNCCTNEIKFCISDDIYFMDTPGIYQEDQDREYISHTDVHFVQTNAQKTLILLLVTPDELDSGRGEAFVQNITGIAR